VVYHRRWFTHPAVLAARLPADNKKPGFRRASLLSKIVSRSNYSKSI
jgi:hypothetical protein